MMAGAPLAFLEIIVEEYYRVATAVIRRYGPNHLPDGIIALAGKYMDVAFYQFYGPYEEQRGLMDRFSKLTRKPLFNGDSCYSVPEANMPNPYGPNYTPTSANEQTNSILSRWSSPPLSVSLRSAAFFGREVLVYKDEDRPKAVLNV